MTAREEDFVFNVVWTGEGFTYLRYFVASQMAQSRARFRFLSNGCAPDQVQLMRTFADAHEQVVEVVEVSSDEMLIHGAVLDWVLANRDDGPYFSLVDPDIKARGPFLAAFVERLDDGCAAVTSGRGIWADTDVIPEGHPGVSGEYFYAPDGFVFGSPHFAIYAREPLVDTIERWGAHFSVGGKFDDRLRQALESAGRLYWRYDTGKIVNIMLQHDGHRLCHFEHPNLLHVGGMSHFLSTTVHVRAVPARFETARFSATVLREVCAGRPAPPLPEGLDPELTGKLRMVREELIDLVETYAAFVPSAGP